MTAENPIRVPAKQTESGELKPTNIRPYQALLSRVLGEKIEFPLLSPDKEQTLIETTNEVLATLPPRMQEVLELRCGLSGQVTYTQRGVGQLLDPPVSKERVRQLEAKALIRLRQPACARKLKTLLPLPKDSIARSIAGLDLLHGDLETLRGINFEQLGQLGELISHLTENLKGSVFEIKSLAGFLMADTRLIADENLPEPVIHWMAEELKAAYQGALAGAYKVEQPEEVHEVAPEIRPTQEDTPIDDLRLNTYITNALKRNSVRTVEAVSRLSREDLLGLRCIGPTATEKIEAALIAFYEERWQTTPEAAREELRRSEARRISDMV